VLVGLPSAGKTTVARTIASEHAAVRFTPAVAMASAGRTLPDVLGGNG
jgi:predicted kinase